MLTGRVPVHGAEAAAWAVTVALRPLWQSEAVQATAPGLVVRCGGREWRTTYEHLIVLSRDRERWRPEVTAWLTSTD